MNLTYSIYLLLFVPILIFMLYISKEKVLKDEPTYIWYSLTVLLILIIWGELAMYLRHWFFPVNTNLGVYIGNHPLETIIQGIIFPLFIISVWEFVKSRRP